MRIIKKTLPYILITVLILGAFLGPFSAKQAHAEEEGTSSIINFISDPVGTAAKALFGTFVSFSINSLLWIAANISYWIILTLASAFAYIGGAIMDYGVHLSINSPIFYSLSTQSDTAVTAGWAIARDIVNLSLIFILLYIAIATILQISGYGAKQLLATLIIIAFLVNFSLVITRIVVDASNILALEFYNKLRPADNQGGIISLSQIFMTGTQLQKIWDTRSSFSSFGTNQTTQQYLNIILICCFSAVMLAIIGFVFLVSGVLFFTRMVFLLILMALSPLAFAARILPATQGHFRTWLHHLLNQSFFAPAFLFMIWFAAKIATSPFIPNALGINRGDLNVAGIFEGITSGGPTVRNLNAIQGHVALLVQFAIIIILLLFSLTIAKRMGAIGADVTKSMLKTAGQKLQGYAGRIGRRYAAPVTKALEEKFPKVKAALEIARKIPFVTGRLEKIPVAAQAEVKKYEQEYDSYSNSGLKNLISSPLLNRSQRIAILNLLTKHGDLKDDPAKGFGARRIQQAMKYAEAIGTPLKDVYRLRPELAPDMEEAIKTIRPEDIVRLDKSILTSDKKEEFLKLALTYFKPGHITKLVERGDELFTEYLEALKSMAKDSNKLEDITDFLRKTKEQGGANNPGLAKWMESQAGRGLLGIKSKKEAEAEEAEEKEKAPPKPPKLEPPFYIGGEGKRTPESQKRMEEAAAPKRKQEKDIKGEGFTMRERSSFGGGGPGVEFKTGESSPEKPPEENK